jgi:coenzyme F420 hydrogenase subunit delta
MAAKETDIYNKEMLIFGCGNILFGNDGFGPAVINHLESSFAIPEDVLAMDVGTGIRDFIFDLLLMEKKPAKLIVIDAVTFENKAQGEIFEIEPSRMPKEKMSDFSLHQSPSSNLLSQLNDQGVDVKILAMHTASIPNKIHPGLCEMAQKAIPQASDWIINQIKAHHRSKEKARGQHVK